LPKRSSGASPLSERAPGPQRFVILCLGRTGSTHLQSMLDHHSQSRCYGEIFGDGKPPTFASAATDDAAAFVGELLAGGSERAAGFKLPINSIRREPRSADVVRGDPAMAVIRLSRANRLAQLVSRQLLATTGVSQSIFGSYGEATVTLDPAACVRALNRIAEEEAELDELAAGHATFRILYEELGDELRLEELQRFLGLDPEPLRSWFERLRTRPLAETVSNWDEVAAALRGTPHEALLSAPD
jgi:hypothetical protein